MKEAIVGKGLTVDIVDVPIPEPAADQVLIKIVFSGTNPKDWKRPELAGFRGNQGDDMAGIVIRGGPGVFEFRPGDRVAALHEMMTPHGSYAEYGIAWQHTTFHLPDNVSFETAATMPLAALTAAFGLYKELRLPDPWRPRADADPPLPLLIYGASTAVGAFAVQLARRSNIHPIIAIAGASSDFVRDLLTADGIDRRGDAVVDYRQGEDAVVADVHAALARAAQIFARAEGGTAPPPSLQVTRAFDPASYEGGYVTLAKLLTGTDARLAVIAPQHDYREIIGRTPPLVIGKTFVGHAHAAGAVGAADRDFAYVYSRYLGRGLHEGWLRGHPHVVVPGGLDGVGQALRDLKDGKAHGVKYVIQISDNVLRVVA